MSLSFQKEGAALTSFPKELFGKEYINLEELKLSKNKLPAIPLNIAFSKLTSLDLSFNQITEVPYEITKMKALITLNLSNNKITTVSWEISTLPVLDTLLLSANHLKWFPSCKFPQLRVLDLKNNFLKTLPHDLASTTTLHLLSIFGNPIKDISKEFVNLMLESTSQGEIEQIYNKTMDYVSQHFGDGKMNLSTYDYDTIPQQIEIYYDQITDLDISHNNIKSLVPILKMKNLSKLNASYNVITTLPEGIKALSQLKYINISNNKVTQIPEELTLLRNLTTLLIENNSFEENVVPIFSMLDEKSHKQLEDLDLLFHRHKFYKTVLKNELDYIQNLNVLKSTYMSGIKQQKLMSDQKMSKLFIEIPAIIEINRTFYEKLEKEVPDVACKDIDLGALFLKSADYFRLYTRFLSQFEDLKKLLVDEVNSNKTLKQFITNVTGNYNISNRDAPIDFFAIFESPFNRINDYVMILKDLVDLTPKGHPSMENIIKAINCYENLFEEVRVQKEQIENLEKMKTLAKELKDDTILLDGRILIDCYEKVDVYDNDVKKPVNQKIYVFSDMILIGKLKFYNHTLMLDRPEGSTVRMSYFGGNRYIVFQQELHAQQFYATWYIFVEKFWPNFIKSRTPNDTVHQALLTPRGSRSTLILANSKRLENGDMNRRQSTGPTLNLIGPSKSESKLKNTQSFITPSKDSKGSPQGTPNPSPNISPRRSSDMRMSPTGSILELRRSSSDLRKSASMDMSKMMIDKNEQMEALKLKLQTAISNFHIEKAHGILDEMRRLRVNDEVKDITKEDDFKLDDNFK